MVLSCDSLNLPVLSWLQDRLIIKAPLAFLFTDKWSFILSISQRGSLSPSSLLLPFPAGLSFTPLYISLLWFCCSFLEPCLRLWPQRLPSAGGWQWLLSLRICCSPLCCWDGDRSSSCSSPKASTLTFATRRVSYDWCFSMLTTGSFQFLQYCLYSLPEICDSC